MPRAKSPWEGMPAECGAVINDLIAELGADRVLDLVRDGIAMQAMDALRKSERKGAKKKPTASLALFASLDRALSAAGIGRDRHLGASIVGSAEGHHGDQEVAEVQAAPGGIGGLGGGPPAVGGGHDHVDLVDAPGEGVAHPPASAKRERGGQNVGG